MNVVLYLRYSSDKQTEQSIEGQERVCRNYCENEGYTIVGTYIDRAYSAYKSAESRPEFQRMIADAEKQACNWNGIVVYKLDRFARNRFDSATYKAKLKKVNVRVISATECVSDNPEGIILESVLEGMAEFYSAELSQKINRGLYESALKASSTGGRTPLGYKVVDKKLVLDEITAPLVKRAFEMYDDGVPMIEICRIFNNEGYRTSRGAEFNKNSFRNLFKNERYMGVYHYKDIRIENAVPAIVDEELFKRVQHRLADRAYTPGRAKAKVDYLLSGKVFCGACGGSLIGDCGTARNGTVQHYYSCVGKRKAKTCHKKAIGKEQLESAVLQSVKEWFKPDFVEHIADVCMAEIEKQNNSTDELRQATALLNDIDRKVKNLISVLENGGDSGLLTPRLNELSAQRKDALFRLEMAEKTYISIERDFIVFWLTKFLDGDINDPIFARHLMDAFVSRVDVYDDHIITTFAIGDSADAHIAPPKHTQPNQIAVFAVNGSAVFVSFTMSTNCR